MNDAGRQDHDRLIDSNDLRGHVESGAIIPTAAHLDGVDDDVFGDRTEPELPSLLQLGDSSELALEPFGFRTRRPAHPRPKGAFGFVRVGDGQLTLVDRSARRPPDLFEGRLKKLLLAVAWLGTLRKGRGHARSQGRG